MNLRKVFKCYMSWYPNIKVVSRIKPDVEIPRSLKIAPIIISLGLVIIVWVIAQSLTQREAAPLRVMVNGEVFYDDVFTEDFDYLRLVRKERGLRIYFFEPIDPNEFAEEVEIERFEVKSLRDVWPLLDRLKMPNIVRGFARTICNGSYLELATIFFDGGPGVGIGIGLGDYGGLENRGGAMYSIRRTPATWEEVEKIRISKGYIVNPLRLTGATIWSLEIKVYSFPPFEVKLVRYPRYAQKW